MQSRRPAPSILFTAIAATVIVVPWTLSGAGEEPHHPAADAPALTQQPLDNLGGGETVREIHQDEPFSMVALTAQDLEGTSARIRAKKADGSWGPWYEAEALDGVGADSPGPHGTDPVFVGRTNTVQIAVTRPEGAAPTPPAPAAGDKPDLGYRPATVQQPLGQNLTAVLI
ncbi:cold-shock protein, partial [Mycobacterium goodii]